MKGLFDEVRACLLITDAAEKVTRTRALQQAWLAGELNADVFGTPVPVEHPGRPEKPELVHPMAVPRRRLTSPQGIAAMLHAIAHIEFNAINLALDAVQRFPDMPAQFYADWLRVADEEALHFDLINTHLKTLGYQYGDFPAHGSLWEMCVKTADDVMHRMALVPRVLEARGLDMTPEIQKKLAARGLDEAVSILDVILRDEVGHVEIGSRWFRYCCEQRGLDPYDTFFTLLKQHFPKGLFGPFNIDARRKGGFSEHELEILTQGL